PRVGSRRDDPRGLPSRGRAASRGVRGRLCPSPRKRCRIDQLSRWVAEAIPALGGFEGLGCAPSLKPPRNNRPSSDPRQLKGPGLALSDVVGRRHFTPRLLLAPTPEPQTRTVLLRHRPLGIPRCREQAAEEQRSEQRPTPPPKQLHIVEAPWLSPLSPVIRPRARQPPDSAVGLPQTVGGAGVVPRSPSAWRLSPAGGVVGPPRPP